MKAIIVEDEQLSTAELIGSLGEVAPWIEVVAVARSVEQAVEVIGNVPYDLIFMDINLGDGKSFDIFDRVEVTAPVIFITAYDQYALQAFRNKGIDYLLKPFSREELRSAIDKLGLLGQSVPLTVASAPNPVAVPMVDHTVLQERFLVNIGAKMRSVAVDEIAYFMADGKYLHMRTFDGADYIVDSTITGVSERLSTRRFFQINRKFIISFESISEMIKHSNNRVKVILSPAPTVSQESVVSAERVQEFRQWLNR